MKINSNNLLIVEDQSFIQEKIKDEAKKINVFDTIHVSSTLKDALAIIDNEEINVISLDLSLPDGSGLKVLSMLKEKNIQKDVLVFSASTEMEKISLRYGANHFFDKKNGLEPLIETLKSYQNPILKQAALNT